MEGDKSKLIKHISANTLQVLGNQCLGVFIFLLISRGLDKPSFGELSWSLAVLTITTTLLSLRLEQIVVRNVAAGDNPSGMLTLFAAHNFFTGLIFFGVLSLVCYLYPGLGGQHSLLWILSISQILTFWALPFPSPSPAVSSPCGSQSDLIPPAPSPLPHTVVTMWDRAS